MKIWELSHDTKYETISFVDQKLWSKFSDFTATSYKETWGDISAVTNKDATDRMVGDVVCGVCGAIALKKSAYEILKTLVNGRAEFLPIKYNGDDVLYIMNVLNINDCLDYENSVFKYSRDVPPKIIMYKKFAFLNDKVQKCSIFKIPETVSSRVFITNDFKIAIENSGLKGFTFLML